MNRDYSSIYTIKDFFQKVIPLYFDKDELALSTVGALGMFIDINNSEQAIVKLFTDLNI